MSNVHRIGDYKPPSQRRDPLTELVNELSFAKGYQQKADEHLGNALRLAGVLLTERIAEQADSE